MRPTTRALALSLVNAAAVVAGAFVLGQLTGTRIALWIPLLVLPGIFIACFGRMIRDDRTAFASIAIPAFSLAITGIAILLIRPNVDGVRIYATLSAIAVAVPLVFVLFGNRVWPFWWRRVLRRPSKAARDRHALSLAAMTVIKATMTVEEPDDGEVERIRSAVNDLDRFRTPETMEWLDLLQEKVVDWADRVRRESEYRRVRDDRFYKLGDELFGGAEKASSTGTELPPTTTR